MAISLLALAQAALEAQKTGETHAQMAIEGEELSPQQMAALEKRALIDGETNQALEWLAEAREETFTNPFARADYFRLRIKKLLNEEKPDPEKVLATFFSGRAKNMFVRGTNGIETQPAIPLFRSLRDRGEAAKHTKHTLRPLPIIVSWRRKVSGRDQIGSHGVEYLIPMTQGDQECFVDIKALFARMPEVLVEHMEGSTNYDVREAAWLGLHFMPLARVLTEKEADRQFKTGDDGIIQYGSNRAFVCYSLSQNEILLMEKSELAERFMACLAVYADTMRRMLAQRYRKA